MRGAAKKEEKNLYKLEFEGKIDSAHFIPNHFADCKNMHGHAFHIGVCIETEDLVDNMVIDFKHIKKILGELDHKVLNDLLPIPTAENLSKYLFDKLMYKLLVKVKYLGITVQETDGCKVTFYKNFKGQD